MISLLMEESRMEKKVRLGDDEQMGHD